MNSLFEEFLCELDALQADALAAAPEAAAMVGRDTEGER